MRVPTPDGQKASLFATIGPAGVGGIALSGHTDVVPVTGQAWDTDPFTLVERDGKLYGRGACDMKGFLACVLALVPAFKARQLKVPIHIAFSYDEEVGCTGVRPMIAELGKTLPLPRMVLVGEPTEHDRRRRPQGPDALERRGDRARPRIRACRTSASTPSPTPAACWASWPAWRRSLKALPPNPRFDPPYTTLQVTEIEGGTASNIVPVPCWFGWEIRRAAGLRCHRARPAPAHVRRRALPARDAAAGAGDRHRDRRSATRCRPSRPTPNRASCRWP